MSLGEAKTPKKDRVKERGWERLEWEVHGRDLNINMEPNRRRGNLTSHPLLWQCPPLQVDRPGCIEWSYRPYPHIFIVWQRMQWDVHEPPFVGRSIHARQNSYAIFHSQTQLYPHKHMSWKYIVLSGNFLLSQKRGSHICYYFTWSAIFLFYNIPSVQYNARTCNISSVLVKTINTITKLIICD